MNIFLLIIITAAYSATAEHSVSVLNAAYETSESGIENLTQIPAVQSKVVCAAICLREDKCTGYQVEQGTGGYNCLLKKDCQGACSAESSDTAYLVNYKIINNTRWNSTGYTDSLTMDLRDQCFPSTKMGNSFSYEKLIRTIWQFSKKFEDSVCRVTAIAKMENTTEYGRCENDDQVPYTKIPKFPDGDITFAIARNKLAAVFTDKGKYGVYKFDGLGYKDVSVTQKPPQEHKIASAATVINGYLIMYLNNATFTCYNEDKFLNWANGNKVTWTTTREDKAHCNDLIHAIQNALNGKLTGQLIGMSQIFQTHLIVSNASLTCQFNLN